MTELKEQKAPWQQAQRSNGGCGQMDFTHHEEVGLHERVHPLPLKNEGCER